MSKQQDREYELEMARETDSEDQTPAQREMIRVADISASFDSERVEAIADRRSSDVEDRLINSYQLYAGQRDSQGNDSFDNVELPVAGSRAYTNIVRQITNDGAAQLGDLLFPNDDRNYGLKPLRLAKPPLAIEAEPAVDSKSQPIVDAEGNQLTNAQAHIRRVERTKKKTSRMFAKVDMALISARYPTKARKVIADGAIYGTGILKGPLPIKNKKGRWAKKAAGGYALNKDVPMGLDVLHVNPLDFFPDMSATEIDGVRYIWERSYLLAGELETAVETLGYKAEAANRLLDQGPMQINSDQDTVQEAKASSVHEARATGRFEQWQRHGFITSQQAEDLGIKKIPSGRNHNAIITMCQGEMLKAVIVPYESDDPLYSIYCWDEDPLSIFGYGIPWLMQDQQRSYVSTWRMALDNGGMSAVPQLVIDKEGIEPVNGKWEITGGKEWYKTGENYSAEGAKNPFEVHHIKQNLDQLFAMMDRCVADSYEITGVTRVNKTQQGLDNSPVTLGATQIVQNNTSVSRRAQARRWDDNVTLGFITRVYDYFMQFEDDDDIKANMEVEPRGATVLLAKELTATNTIQLYQMTGNGQAEGSKGIAILRGIESAMQIPSGTYIESEDETDTRVAQEQEQAQAPDPEMELRNREVEVKEAEIELLLRDRDLNDLKATQKYEIDMLRLQLEEATSVAHLDDKSQDRIDKYHADMEALREKQTAELQRHAESNRTARDLGAAKINADNGLKGREQDLKEREVANAEREMSYKETTGKDGI